MIPRPPRSPLFPYTTLFRSVRNAVDPSRPVGAGAEVAFRLAGDQPPVTLHPRLEEDASRVTNERCELLRSREGDRKSTRLNSSHSQISYAVFCLKKKKKKIC